MVYLVVQDFDYGDYSLEESKVFLDKSQAEQYCFELNKADYAEQGCKESFEYFMHYWCDHYQVVELPLVK